MINEFHFSSNVPNFIAFGPNLGLMEFFKVIQCPKFHWIWTKPRDTLGSVSDRKTTLTCTWKATNICKIFLLSLCFGYPLLGLVIGVVEVV